MNEPRLPYFNPHDTSDENLRRAVGQLLVVGFPGNDPEPPAAITDALAAGDIGGVILFRRNVADIDQVVRLNAAIHEAGASADAPPFVAVDQEGGRVVRLKDPLTPIPPMRAIGATEDWELACDVAEVIATEISAVGFNLNFSPVLDVDTNPDNPVIGDRAFSRDPEIVAQMGWAFLHGHHVAGVVPCGKHFPGHGDTDTDSHLELPVLNHPPERFEEVELVPFRKAISADIPMLMTAHVMVPALDTVHPATLSHAVMHRLLREELGYEGVVITDDLEMKAVADRYDVEEMVELGLRAGVDIFLICHTQQKWERAHDHLLELATNNDLDRHRVLESANRVMDLKRGLLGSWKNWSPPSDWRDVLGCEEHRAVLARLPEADDDLVDPTESTEEH
jgi:beta-N-acetylhexosaminidase